MKAESEKASFKLNIKKTKIMASGPITSWQTEGEKVGVVTDFFFLGSKITVDGDCSHEFRRRLLLGRKAMTNLDNVLKSKDITLPTKAHIVARLLLNHERSQDSWPLEEKNSIRGKRQGFIAQSFGVIKFY